VNASYLSKTFLKARNESRYFSEMTDPPSFHEIRALNSHLQKKAGIATHETQVLLGHASEEMTEHYQERHEVVWQEVNKNVLGKFWEFLKQEGKK
jgi:integrase